MTHNRKTLWYVATAALLLLLALVLSPRRITPDAFLDQGEPFFPDFQDPNEAVTLEVIDFDAVSGLARPFKVTYRDNHWTIPSHHDYPADGKDRLAKSAAGVIGIVKDDFRTSSIVDHESCGVIDPLDATAPGLEGRGKRITLRGADGGTLADFVVGAEVPDRPGLRFVRVPDQNRVYAARMDIDISTTFADWIETNLLEISKNDIVSVGLKAYRIDERTLSVVPGDNVFLNRRDNSWGIDRAGGRSVDTSKVGELLMALEELTIVGVRPKPEGVSAGLSRTAEGPQISRADQVSLQEKGFYFSRDGQLLSNEGELMVRTGTGVIYTLRFGEVLYGSGLAVSAGDGDAPQGGETANESRYLFVTAAFDQSGMPRPPAPSNVSFLSKPDSLLTKDDRQNKLLQLAVDRWQSTVDQGQEIAARLNERFGAWYYLISGSAFEQLHFSRQSMLATDGS